MYIALDGSLKMERLLAQSLYDIRALVVLLQNNSKS